MAPLRRHVATTAHPWRWILANILGAALLCEAAAGLALSPAPSTPIVNRVTLQYGDANGNSLPSVSASVSVPIAGAPLLRLEKTADSDPVAAGATFTYTLRYENSGNAAATGVTLVDTLPTNVVFRAASAGGVHDSGHGTVTWNLGSLAAGNGGFLTVTAQSAGDLAVGTAIVNTALLTSTEGVQASAVLTTKVGSGPNLVLTKAGAPPTVTPNGIIAYALSYRNLGNTVAHTVSITDRVPAGTAYVAGSATPAASLAGGSLTWNIGDLAAGGEGTANFQVRVSPLAVTGQQISNAAAIASGEQTAASNTVVTTVSAQSLLLLKMDTPDPVRAGRNLSYTLQVENTGAVPLTGVILSDPLPIGTSFVSADSAGVLAATGRQVDWDLGNLAVGQKQSVTLLLRIDPALAQGQLLDNTASAVSNETPPQSVRTLSTVNARTPGAIEFDDVGGQPTLGYMSGNTIFIQVNDLDQNADPATAETVTVVLMNLQTADSETVLLTETGANTGIFRGGIPTTLTATAAGSGTLTVAANSRVRATYNDPLDASPISTATALIDPLGIVFDSVTGTPLTGAVVTLRSWNGGANACDLTSWPVLPAGQVNPAVPTGADGKFAFPLVPAGDYCYQVTPPAGYVFPSTVADADLPAGFTIGSGSRGDKFTLNVGDPPLVRDIPLDPPTGRMTITKTANKTTAAIGDLIAYGLKLTNSDTAPVTSITITDVMPHGVLILPGSSRLDGVPLVDPRQTGARTLAWSLARLARSQSAEITYRAVVGPDATRGDGVNTVSAAGVSLGRAIVSNTASFKVKITGGIFTDKGTILGKIFLDRDGNRIQNQGVPAKPGQPDEPGIPKVALYLEDGTRVLTDQNGKFSLLGIAPGTHVLRVDEATLPKGLSPVPLSNRFLGDAASQFVAMQAGGLVQADFAVQGDWVPEKEPAAPTSTRRAEPKPEVPGRPATLPAEGVGRAAPAGQPATPSTEGQTAEAVRAPALPAAQPSPTAERSIPEPAAISGIGGEGAPAPPAAPPAAGPVSQRPEKPASQDWEEAIQTMTPDLDFLNPIDGSALVRERIRVVLKTPFGTVPSLSLNGTPVADKQIGRKIDYQKGQVTIYEYIGIHLNANQANVLQVEVKDPFGIVRGAKRITVTAAGTPERIVIKTDRTEVPADGESQLRVSVEIMDRQGRVVPYTAFATVSVSAGEIVEKDADPAMEEFQIALREGIGTFTVRAPRETGEAAITAAVGDCQETAKVFFAPHLREFFAVGMGEVTFGYGRGKGSFGLLKDQIFDDGPYSGGRGAFFAKGRIAGDALLTAAYDSNKKKRSDLFRENDTTLDTEDKYPIYGDESKTGYEALSTDKLYLKLEKDRSYLLYGDYKTDLNETRLAAYNRSFNGLKGELNTPRLKLRTFGSHTDQTQVVDTLPGKGISGYYYLTKRPVMEGSERVLLEVRDRYWPDRVLSRESKGRGSDYEIDYDAGAILFKGAIPSHNSDFNPLYIVVSYESQSEDNKYYVYGGRGAFTVLNSLELGATGVIEEKEIGRYHLIGTDLTLKLPRKTIVKGEYVQTQGAFEESSLLNWYSDHGWSVSLESEPIEKLRLGGHYRELGDHFLNLSAADVSRGTTNYGLDATYQLRPDTQFRGRFVNEQDDLNHIKHRLVAVGGQTKFWKSKIEAEISNESVSDTYVPLTTSPTPFNIKPEIPHELTAAKIGFETQLQPDLSLTLNHKHNLSGEGYHLSQAGLNYQLNSLNRLYLREEYQHYQDKDEMRTLFGAETQLIKNTVAFNEYRLADGSEGSRNQSVLGLRNKFFLGKETTGNVSAEYLKTVSGTQGQTEPDVVAASLGLEYLAKENLKVTGRAEHRREFIDDGRQSYLGEVGVGYKLHPDYSLLLRERFFTEDVGTGGWHTTSRAMAGLAYRPRLSNRFNALMKAEYKHESNASSTPTFREEAWIFAGEGVWQATPRLQLTGKYAGKLSRDGDFSSYTDLISGRFVYDLTDRWDVGAEYRVLTSHRVSSRYQGGAVEIGYRLIKNLWAAIGYSFNKYDPDLAGDGYQGQGPYLRLRVKFGEDTFKGLRKALPSGETPASTSAR